MVRWYANRWNIEVFFRVLKTGCRVERVWAMAAAEDPRMPVAEKDRPEIAARYQLVTSVSGAVVLETMEQFKRHGLTPVDADAAPQVPTRKAYTERLKAVA